VHGVIERRIDVARFDEGDVNAEGSEFVPE
jgi:hypothetical protein